MNILLRNSRAWIDEAFDRALSNLAWHPELERQARYALIGGGKALRPSLAFWTYAQLTSQDSRPPQDLVDAALALEMIHTYSLVHDDLPAMDNDDLRRGKPTLHRLHGVASAILVGDALLTGAFEVLGATTLGSLAVREVARAAGGAGMVSGQMRDLFETADDLAALERVHREKTGALFGTAVVLGALASGMRNEAKLVQAREWGVELGLLFQIVDDILDATVDSAQLGKTAGKDERSGKRTYVSLLSLEAARQRAQAQKTKVVECGQAWGIGLEQSTPLLDFILSRRS